MTYDDWKLDHPGYLEAPTGFEEFCSSLEEDNAILVASNDTEKHIGETVVEPHTPHAHLDAGDVRVDWRIDISSYFSDLDDLDSRAAHLRLAETLRLFAGRIENRKHRRRDIWGRIRRIFSA